MEGGIWVYLNYMVKSKKIVINFGGYYFILICLYWYYLCYIYNLEMGDCIRDNYLLICYLDILCFKFLGLFIWILFFSIYI